ncbi:Dynamin-3 [Dissostichus eleginoides]|uniref:Dynamin-3 n=1 Tax=Dissostichus eleginoides TaxID=100907 RepID=A0AAD9FF96_DISEL|nr:Dynamin-3 [Dissostichus eleginoides]
MQFGFYTSGAVNRPPEDLRHGISTPSPQQLFRSPAASLALKPRLRAGYGAGPGAAEPGKRSVSPHSCASLFVGLRSSPAPFYPVQGYKERDM